MKSKTPSQKKTKLIAKSKYPRFNIERWGTDDAGRLTFIDIHDEERGEAIFFGEGSRHSHGRYNAGKHNGGWQWKN